jgi:hypothetical protein
MDDPIVAEVRKARRGILEAHGWDCRRMLQDAMKRQAESGRKVIRLGKKTSREGVAPKIYDSGTQR